MGKIIVTTDLFTGYSTVFDVTKPFSLVVKRMGVFDSNDIDEDLSAFPIEIRDEIFDRVVFTLIRTGRVRKAMGVLLRTDMYTCSRFYKRYISRVELTRSQLISHVISLFKLVYEIGYEIASETQFDEELYLTIKCKNETLDIIADGEWPFGDIEASMIDEELLLFTYPDIKRIKVGGRYSDIVWVSGLEDRGMIITSLLRGPVVVLEFFYTLSGMNICTSTRFTSFFSNVVKILKLRLGGVSGVYVSTPIVGFPSLIEEVV